MPKTSLALALVAVFLLSASVLAEPQSDGPKVRIKFEAGPNPIGIFFVGNQTKAFKGHTVCADPWLRYECTIHTVAYLNRLAKMSRTHTTSHSAQFCHMCHTWMCRSSSQQYKSSFKTTLILVFCAATSWIHGWRLQRGRRLRSVGCRASCQCWSWPRDVSPSRLRNQIRRLQIPCQSCCLSKRGPTRQVALRHVLQEFDDWESTQTAGAQALILRIPVDPSNPAHRTQNWHTPYLWGSGPREGTDLQGDPERDRQRARWIVDHRHNSVQFGCRATWFGFSSAPVYRISAATTTLELLFYTFCTCCGNLWLWRIKIVTSHFKLRCTSFHRFIECEIYRCTHS